MHRSISGTLFHVGFLYKPIPALVFVFLFCFRLHILRFFPLSEPSKNNVCFRVRVRPKIMYTLLRWQSVYSKNENKRKVQGVPQSQTATNPDIQRKRRTKITACKINKQMHEEHKTSFLFPKPGDRNAKRTEKKSTRRKSKARLNSKRPAVTFI